METKFGKVTATKIQESKFKKGVEEVELRQEVTRQYDGMVTSNSLRDSMFSAKDLGLEGKSYTETRVAWDVVPVGFSTEQYQELLDTKFPNARLCKVLSHSIILNDQQERVYRDGLSKEALTDFTTKHGIDSDVWNDDCRKAFIATVANAQIIRYGENNSENKPAKEPVLYNGKAQYRVISLSLDGKEDVDLRIEKAVTQSIDLAPTGVNVGEKVSG